MIGYQCTLIGDNSVFNPCQTAAAKSRVFRLNAPEVVHLFAARLPDS
jgi:hypothetical protein